MVRSGKQEEAVKTTGEEASGSSPSPEARLIEIPAVLSVRQLAERLQVSAARVSVLEKDEARGAVTLKMMEKAARAMGCRFEYRIVQQTDKEENSQQGRKPRYRVVPE